MLLQVIKPFRFRLRGQPLGLLSPGQVLTLARTDAEKLITEYPWLVKVLTTVKWRSPLFGLCEGRVLMVEGEQVLVEHTVIGRPTWICRSWIILEKGEDRAS